jgi:ectoine hydroxylase-related dioxygenase (phytanoyl-CoA dioxygenase family)
MRVDIKWENEKPCAECVAEWVEAFHRDGYLVMENVLNSDLVAELKDDLDKALGTENTGGMIELQHRMFETSRANLCLFDLEPVVSFAEALIDGACHVIHNNSFRVREGKGIVTWHQDDASHYIVTHGEPPTNVRLPVLLFTANYYLTDVPEREYGPTEVIPKSHLFGGSPPPVIEGTKWEPLVDPCVGSAGTVVLFNNQVWHRGGPNQTDRVRYMTQVSYARRLVGHKYYPFMNYVMPEHVYADANPRLKRLLGFLPTGPYG